MTKQEHINPRWLALTDGGISPITGLRTPAFPPPVRPVAENAGLAAAVHLGLRDAFPMLEIDQRNAAIVDALNERGQVTITVGPNGLEIT